MSSTDLEIEAYLPGVRGLGYQETEREGDVMLQWLPPLLDVSHQIRSYIVERFEDSPLKRWSRVATLNASTPHFLLVSVDEDVGVRVRVYGVTFEGAYLTPAVLDVPPVFKHVTSGG